MIKTPKHNRIQRMKSKRPTQTDVAKRAGVSRGTVSLVLNKRETQVAISQETRERVVAAARELGYLANPVAQMLARGRNQIIGFLTFDEVFPYSSADFYNPYLVGVEREAGIQGYNVLLFTRKSSGETYRESLSALRLADGLILTGNQPDESLLRELAQENYPFVLLGTCDIPTDEIDSVESDHAPASYAATQHLLSLGHRNIGFLVDALRFSHHRERLAGSERAVGEVADATLVQVSGEGLNSAEILQQTLQHHQLTALVCADRSLYAKLTACLQQLPIEIPNDLSLVFLSDVWGVPYLNPTRVQLNRDHAGRVAVQRLLQRLAGVHEGFQQQRVSCEFVVGATTTRRR